MEKPLSRRDVGYTIISRFEECYRYFLAEKLLTFYGNFLEGIPPVIIDIAKQKASTPEFKTPEELLQETDFPHLTDVTFYNDMYKRYFPDICKSGAEFQEIMGELYFLRIKIAHIKGIFTSIDIDRLLEYTKLISNYLGAPGGDFLQFIKELQEHPEDIVIPMPLEFSSDAYDISSVPNNLPTPDYEYEGGFIGRDEDIKKILKLLEEEQFRVITIAGAGGVGKTALALRVIQKILQKRESMFDGVVWLSAKETKLSYLGIEDIESTVKNYEQLLDTIFEVMGFGSPSVTLDKKESDVNTIFDLHNRILIAIDNLETIDDDRIINFIIESPPKIKILITSRTGLGQVERRHDLKQLKEKEAVYLFRQVSRDKYLDSLAQLGDETIKAYVKKLSYYPLAIKWVIGQVAIGKDINKVIASINETTSDISRFCFEQIFKKISTSARKILCALSCIDEPPTAGVLKYVVNLSQNDFDDGIRELILVSLIIPEQYRDEKSNILTRYGLLSLTRGYVRQKLETDSMLKHEIEDRLNSVRNTIEEADRAKKQYRFSLAYLGATTEEEKVASVLAQSAFQKYQAGRYADAVEDYKRARDIAPHFAALYRNWAVMESQERHYVEADELMKKATKLNPNDPLLWQTWGNIKRKADRLRESIDYYKRALDLSPDDCYILNAFGQARARLGEYNEADLLFKQALKQGDSPSSIKNEIINRSSLADNLRRWAESLEKDRNYELAENKLKEAMEHIDVAIKLDKYDLKSLDLRREIFLSLGFCKRYRSPDIAIEYFNRTIVKNPKRFYEARDTLIAAIQIAKIHLKYGEYDKAKGIFTPEILRIKEPLKRDIKLQLSLQSILDDINQETAASKGKIIRIDSWRRFAIIESESSPGITYLAHLNDFIEKPTEFSEMLVGKEVKFIPKEIPSNEGTKKIASQARILGEN